MKKAILESNKNETSLHYFLKILINFIFELLDGQFLLLYMDFIIYMYCIG